MNKIFTLIGFFFLFVLPALAQEKLNFSAKTKENIYLFRQGKFETLYERMDKDMKRILDADKLQGFWDVLIMRMGEIQEVGETKITDRDSLIIALTPIQFEKQKLGFKLVYNKEGQIAGMYIDAPSPQYQPASYVNALNFYENKKTLPDPKYPVEGVLTIPAKGDKFPIVIIAAGSGPTDKDLTLGPNRIYKDLAWGLANIGIAVFRFDKRTKTYGSEMAKNKNLTVKDEYLTDLQLAVRMIKNHPNLDSNKCYILGHSEGGYLIPYFEKNIKGINGYIGFGANYSELANLMSMQLEYLKQAAPKEQQNSYDPLIRQANYAKNKLSETSPADSLPMGLSATYLVHLNQNGPSHLASILANKKVLFIQGGRDYQVPPSELEFWRSKLSKNTRAEFEVFSALNHLGLEGKGPSLPAEYENPGNIPEEVINRIGRFILY